MNTHRHLEGSERKEFTKGVRGKATNPWQKMGVTVVLTPDSQITHAHAVAQMARRFGLIAQRRGLGPQSIRLRGTVAQMQKAFQVSLHDCKTEDGEVCRCRSGPLSIPTAFGSNIVAVLGLDTRPQARAHHHPRATPRAAGGLMARAVARAYGFPANAGLGHSVGIIELGGAYQPAEMAWYFRRSGIKRAPNVVVRGTQRAWQSGATVEVMLDAEIIAAVVPNARVVIYFGPNTTAGFYNAIARAVAAGHDAVSISWGAPEQYWTHGAMTAFDNLARAAGEQGVTITAASGDAGSSDGVSGVEVDFPASAPHILGCGGTNLVVTAGAYGGETVWNGSGGATGGGLSEFFARPSYQDGIAAGRTMRLVPDVAANADPATGFLIRVHAQSMAVGGTSAASPLWAALICRLNKVLGRRLGFVQPALYGLPPGSLRDIASGNNGAYEAAIGHDCCTGLGSIPANLASLLA